jgi:hypothetical protein
MYFGAKNGCKTDFWHHNNFFFLLIITGKYLLRWICNPAVFMLLPDIVICMDILSILKPNPVENEF